jgi:hypothetical protein
MEFDYDLERNQVLGAAAGTILVMLVVVPLALNSMTLEKDTTTLEMNASGVNTTGDNLQLGLVADSKLDFGEVPVESSSTKFINISTDNYARVRLDASGEIADKLDYKKQVWVDGDESISVKFEADEEGSFEGKMTIKTLMAKNNLGKTWLDLRYG